MSGVVACLHPSEKEAVQLTQEMQALKYLVGKTFTTELCLTSMFAAHLTSGRELMFSISMAESKRLFPLPNSSAFIAKFVGLHLDITCAKDDAAS